MTASEQTGAAALVVDAVALEEVFEVAFLVEDDFTVGDWTGVVLGFFLVLLSGVLEVLGTLMVTFQAHQLP